MHHFAFTAVFFSLALLSLGLASPLPVQAIKGARGTTVGLNAREVTAGHEILRREASASPKSGVGLRILAREYEMFEGVIGEKDAARDPHKFEPRICSPRLCPGP